MKPTVSRRAAALLLGAAMASAATCSLAQDFPNRPIRIIVGFGPGIGMDVTTRMLADVISKDQGIPVLVENKPGAATMLATNYVAQSPKDGYTLLTINNQQYNNPLMYRNVTYKNSDFIPITAGGLVSMVMAVAQSVPAKTAREFIDYAKANPDNVFYGYWGAGGSPHLMAAMLEKATGVRMRGVPYKDSGQATSDLAAGRIHLFFTSVTHGLPLHQSGLVRIIAVGTPQRLPALADVPTFSESGIEGVPNPWWGYAAPAGTPKEVVQALERILGKGTASPRYQALLAQTGSFPLSMKSPDEFETFIGRQTELWGSLIRPLKLQLD